MSGSTDLATIKFGHPAGESDIQFVRGKNVGHTFPCHIHHSFILGVITKGERIIHVDGQDIFLATNDCFIINPHQPHSCQMPGEKNHDYWVISISPKIMQAANWQKTGRNDLPRFPSNRISDKELSMELICLSRKQSNGESVKIVDISGVLDRLILCLAEKQTTGQPAREPSLFVQQVCKYIEDNAGQILRLNELAQIVHVSPFYLNRIFRETIGVPPYTYLLQTRIKQSMELLLQIESIAEVGFKMGFSDQSHFSRFFKKNVGLTPRQYLVINKPGMS